MPDPLLFPMASRFRETPHAFFLSACAVSLACLILIWLPNGFALTGLIEEWGTLGVFTQEGPLYFVTSHTSFAAHRLRPLTLFPHALAYRLGPDSFLWWHLIQAFCIGLKGIAAAYIFWWLSPNRRWALFGGLLMMVWPADTMQLSFRSFHINSSVAMLLCAVAALLAATRTERTGWWLGFTGLAAACFILGAWMYEAALFLAPLPLLLWWAKHGLREGAWRLRRERLPLLGWSSACLFSTGYIFYIIRQPALYQAAVSESPRQTVAFMLHQSPMLASVGIYRLAVHGWYDAGRMVLGAPGHWPIMAAAVSGLAVLMLVTREAVPQEGTVHTNRGDISPCRAVLGRSLLVGVAAALLGYLPYLSSLSHLLITQRTYLFATFGMVLVFWAIFLWLNVRARRMAGLLAGLLILLGLNAQWVQFSHYTALAARQKMILSGILQAVPEIPEGKRLLIHDRGGMMASTWMLKGELLGSALSYLYGRPTQPLVCMQPGNLWSSFSGTAKGQAGRCVERADAWEIGAGLPAPQRIPKTELIELDLTPDGRVTRADKADVAEKAQARRWASILGCWPTEACRDLPENSRRPDRFFHDFGHWWSMEEAQIGAGWRDEEWAAPAWQPRSHAWMNETESSLWFPLAPRAVPYHLRMRVKVWTLPAAHDALTLILNGHPLAYRWTDPQHTDAEIEASTLVTGMNELRLATPLDPDQGVGLAVDSVRIAPR